MPDTVVLDRLASTFNALLLASDKLEADAPSSEVLDEIIETAVVRPSQNEVIAIWFGRYLTVRQELWNVINQCLDSGENEKQQYSHEQIWSYFIIGYSAACLLVRNDRLFLFDMAEHSVLQRKFNEAFPEYRIPRKQYTRIFSAFVDTSDALRIYDAIRTAKKHRAMINRLCDDRIVGKLAQNLPVFESWLDASKRNYIQRLVAYVSHKWRRKGVVILNNTLSRAVEKVGRAASEINLPLEKRVTEAIRANMAETLLPGDILVTRHDTAFTNLFLPGFWPHAALFIGSEHQRQALGVELSPEQSQRWCGNRCVLEALKDGVHFRPISETLAVDNFVVLRPDLNETDIRQGLERVVQHEGKLYNFDFDFFSSDKLVCSEVPYRAFDGLGELTFPLTERAGRKTLSPEDLVTMAIETNGLQIVGVYGVKGCRNHFATGEHAAELVKMTMAADET